MHKLKVEFPEKRRTLLLPKKAAGKVLPVAFFDADNTLRHTKSGKVSPHGRHDVLVFKQTFAKIYELQASGYLLAIISNQAGIKLGYISTDEVEDALNETLRIFAENNIYFNYYDYAEQYDNNRKPDTGMAWRLERELLLQGYSINWQESFMIGDAAWKRGKDLQPDGSPGSDHANSDRRFAENIAIKHPGFGFFHPRHFFDNWPKEPHKAGLR